MIRALSILLLLALAESPETEKVIAQHLHSVSQTMAHEVAFEETRSSPLLAQPLISEGRLTYRPEDRALIKTILTPEQATLLLSDRDVELTANGRSRRFSLKSRPELLALQGGFRSLVQGDFDTLNRFFSARLDWDLGNRWALHLVPRNQRLKRHLTRITVEGVNTEVTTITTELSDGELKQMVLKPAPG